jgi:hypothetical protein
MDNRVNDIRISSIFGDFSSFGWMNGRWVNLPMIFSYHNIIYYKTPFVKERLPKPIGHNDEFFGVDPSPQRQVMSFFAPEATKRGGYAHVTPSKGEFIPLW